jgi:hypothetical protein
VPLQRIGDVVISELDERWLSGFDGIFYHRGYYDNYVIIVYEQP